MPMMLSCLKCLRIFSSRRVRFALVTTSKALGIFLMATCWPDVPRTQASGGGLSPAPADPGEPTQAPREYPGIREPPPKGTPALRSPPIPPTQGDPDVQVPLDLPPRGTQASRSPPIPPIQEDSGVPEPPNPPHPRGPQRPGAPRSPTQGDPGIQESPDAPTQGDPGIQETPVPPTQGDPGVRVPLDLLPRGTQASGSLTGVAAAGGADDAVGAGADGLDDLVLVPHLEGDVQRPRLQQGQGAPPGPRTPPGGVPTPPGLHLRLRHGA